MRIVRTTAVLIVAASTVALVGCMPSIASGPATSEEREIASFAAVVLDTSGDLIITEGEPSLVIHAREGALERLTSEVDDGSLVLGSTGGPTFGLGDVRYELTVRDLEAIELNGSGDIDAAVSSDGTIRLLLDGSGDVVWTDLDSDRVEIRVSGSGDVELAGATGELVIELDGSGDIDAADLQTAMADVAVNGSGNVDVSVDDDLLAAIAGSGSITYTGDPTLDTDISGSGEVLRG